MGDIPGYKFDSRFVLGSGMFNGADAPVMAMVGRPALEMYLLLDKDWHTPAERLYVGQMLGTHFEREARAAGFVELFATLPPWVERSFGKRLVAHGWYRQGWASYSKELNG